MNGPTPPPVNLLPGQQPTREQIAAIQDHMRKDAERLGLSMEEYVQKLREAHAAQQAAQQQGGHVHGPNCNHEHDHEHQHGPPPGHQAVQPGPPKPEAMAVAAFLKGQDLKMRTCLFQEKRKDMFRGMLYDPSCQQTSLTT
jgi:translocation protein SEC62